MDIFNGMGVMITQNINKKNGVVNGQIGFVENAQNTTVFVKLPDNLVVPIYLITSLGDGKDTTVFPMCIAYANTMCKAQGQTLKKAIRWFDVDTTLPGATYVVLSRVRVLSDIYFLKPLKSSHFTPVDSM